MHVNLLSFSQCIFSVSQYRKEYIIIISFLSLATVSWLKVDGYSSGNTDGTKYRPKRIKNCAETISVHIQKLSEIEFKPKEEIWVTGDMGTLLKSFLILQALLGSAGCPESVIMALTVTLARFHA